ncbi:hypothetical protein PU560_13915 [Georgenia sp. 10Sc9-8]|uniref:Uncharacterized protein n=1 Tax=Georgenia halotolerans TaxID=3028317 RepID=A0ABT5TZP9_9MICO|nr:hypothetical protein [Georgenia halotolerans]
MSSPSSVRAVTIVPRVPEVVLVTVGAQRLPGGSPHRTLSW